MTMNSRGVEDVSENPKSFIDFVRQGLPPRNTFSKILRGKLAISAGVLYNVKIVIKIANSLRTYSAPLLFRDR